MYRIALSGLLAATALSAPVAAQSAFDCAGEAPDWTLHLSEDAARFQMTTTETLEVMHRAPAEGRDWPRALTLIGQTATAILLLEREECGALPYRAHVLTQRGQTPILLTGCCGAPA